MSMYAGRRSHADRVRAAHAARIAAGHAAALSAQELALLVQLARRPLGGVGGRPSSGEASSAQAWSAEGPALTVPRQREHPSVPSPPGVSAPPPGPEPVIPAQREGAHDTWSPATYPRVSTGDQPGRRWRIPAAMVAEPPTR